MKKLFFLLITVFTVLNSFGQKAGSMKQKNSKEDTLLWYRNLQLNRNDLVKENNKIVRYYNKYNSGTSQFEYVDSISNHSARMIMILQKKDSISDLQRLDEISYTMTIDNKTKRKFISVGQAKELISKNTLVIQNAKFLLDKKTEEDFEKFMNSCLGAITLFKKFFPN